MSIAILGGITLQNGAFVAADLLATQAGISLSAAKINTAQRRLNAEGLMVLPGILDVHGDAFERQIMPRPGVEFPLDIAFIETDRQLVANGITTAFHGVTWSWEPGLRGAENARAIVDILDELRPQLLADTHLHLRQETYNLDAEVEILAWINARRIRILAFNDHMEGIVKTVTSKSSKLGKMIERSGLDDDAFSALVGKVYARKAEVPGMIMRLAAAGQAAGIAVFSHDDRDVDDRRWYRSVGASVAEFPMTEEAAREAVDHGEYTVFGAPNVMRGGSHTGCPAAAEMVGKGLSSILSSDYYYPALAQAPLRLEQAQVSTFEASWALISENPARALGLTDRGAIREGLRADLVLARIVETRLEVVATFVAGRLVYLCDDQLLTA